MPYTKDALTGLFSLSHDDVKKTITAAGLPQKDEYTDEEIDNGFRAIRQLFDDGKTTDYKEAAKLYKNPTYTLQQIQDKISEITLSRVTLLKTLQVLEASGIEEKEDYTKEDYEKIITNLTAVDSGGNIEQAIGILSEQSQEQLAKLIDSVTTKIADAAPQAFNAMYLQKVAEKMAENKNEIVQMYTDMEQRIIASLEGKKTPLQILMEKRQNQIMPMKSAELLPESNSDTHST